MLAAAAGIAGTVAASVGAYIGPTHLLRCVQEAQLRRRASARRALVLTYDDGPGAAMTPRLLDLLQAESATATFFLLGRQIPCLKSIVDRQMSEGHEIGCHGQDHPNSWRSGPIRCARDIAKGYAAIAPWSAGRAGFRPPYGKLSMAGWFAARRQNCGYLGWWTIDSGDTHRQLPASHSVADTVTRAGGGVVLMHDFDRSPERMAFVLGTTELLVRTARREGLTICRYRDLWKALPEDTRP